MDFTGLSVFCLREFVTENRWVRPCLPELYNSFAEMALTEGEFLEIRQIAGSALTDERHGNKILNNEQHLFTA